MRVVAGNDATGGDVGTCVTDPDAKSTVDGTAIAGQCCERDEKETRRRYVGADKERIFGRYGRGTFRRVTWAEAAYGQRSAGSSCVLNRAR